MKLRFVRVAGVAAATLGLVISMTPAHASVGSAKKDILAATDYSGETGGDKNASQLDNLMVSNVTGGAFIAACNADRAALDAGRPATNISTFLSSPANGYDGLVVDLGATFNKGAVGSFKAQGPGSKHVLDIPLSKVPGGLFDDTFIPNYDFDLQFISAPSAVDIAPATAGGSGCNDANPGFSSKNPCYSSTENSDETATCIAGDVNGRGARYLFGSLALNIPVNNAATPGPRPGPVPLTLTWSF